MRRLTACTGHHTVKSSQVSVRNAAAKVVFYIKCGHLFSVGYGYKLVNAKAVVLARAPSAAINQRGRRIGKVTGSCINSRFRKSSNQPRNNVFTHHQFQNRVKRRRLRCSHDQHAHGHGELGHL